MLKDLAFVYYDGFHQRWEEITACAFHLVPDGTQLAVYASKTPHGPRHLVGRHDQRGWFHVQGRIHDRYHRFVPRNGWLEADLEGGFSGYDREDEGYTLSRMGGHIVLQRYDSTPEDPNQLPYGRLGESVLYYNCHDALWEDKPGDVQQTASELTLVGPGFRAGVLKPRPTRVRKDLDRRVQLEPRGRISGLAERADVLV